MSTKIPVRNDGWRRAIVVGASSGIGEQLVRQLVSSGCRVGAVARRSEKLDLLVSELGDAVIAVTHDVTDYDSTLDVFQGVCEELGGLDLVIYAAGLMEPVGLNEFEFGKDGPMFEVNLLGAASWLNLAAQRLQAAGEGTIIGIGSVAGDRGRAGQPAYNASKAGLHAYLEALRNRLSADGVTVATIKPGPVATEMTAKIGLNPSMSAEKAAQLILKKGRKPGEHYLKWTHRLAFAIIRAIPGWMFRRLPLK